MEKGFSQNQLKPGDDGFQYDKRIDFAAAEGGLENDSWGEDSDRQVDQNEDDDEDMDYFDDDFE